jgi:hypothetical protein
MHFGFMEVSLVDRTTSLVPGTMLYQQNTNSIQHGIMPPRWGAGPMALMLWLNLVI